MEVRSSFPIVYVDDVPTSVRFYRDLLGFEEMYSSLTPTRRGT